jgi:hypothetical protein
MRKKELKENNKDLLYHVVDIINLLDPSKTNKFTPLLIKEFKKKYKPIDSCDDVNGNIIDIIKCKCNDEITLNILDVVLHMVGVENVKALHEFNENLNNNKTIIKDITLLNDFGDVFEQLVLSELKYSNSSVKDEIDTLFRNKEWVILKPLSYNSSKIYGSSTKWCTSSRVESDSFYNYSEDGVLIYIINRINNDKIAVHWYLNSDDESYEMSWWDKEDKRIDSMQSNLPNFIIKEIKTCLDNEKNTNSHYFTKSEKNNINLPKIGNPTQTNTAYPHLNLIYNHIPITPIESLLTDVTNFNEGDENTVHVLDVDDAVRKTLEYSHLTNAIKKSVEDL